MRLEEGADLAAADRLLAVIADLLQRLAEAHAVAVLDAERMLQREGAAEHARGHHGRREAAALLVGPHRDLDRRLGDVARIVQHAQHLQPRHHAIGAVELAAGRLGVEMRAGHHRRLGRIAALAAGEDVAELVDLDGAARRLGPAHEEIAALAVEIGERDAADAALLRAADLGQLHQARPQAVGVDLQVGAVGGFHSSNSGTERCATISNASQRNEVLERPCSLLQGCSPRREFIQNVAAVRHARPRPHASHRRPHGRPDPGRHGRRRDQGRAAARRAFPPAFRRRLGAVDEPQQARTGRRPAHRGRPRGADAAGPQGRRLHGGLHAGRDRQAGLRLGQAQQGEPAADLRLGVGLRPDRPLLQPRRLRSLHPGRDRPDGRDRSRRRRDVPRRHRGDRLLDRLVLRRRHRLRPAGAAQDRPRPAARPVAVRCRHAPDEPLDHQPWAHRRGSHPHGHLELDHLPVAGVPDQDPADLHRRHQRRLLEDLLYRARQAGLARRQALRHQRRSRRQPRHPGADDRGHISSSTPATSFWTS